jgi:DNA-binding NarL/FixJ family response regulator
MRTMQKNESPIGLLPVELAQREVDVLRLLAEGLDTVEIANKLSYSERLIKSVIQTVVKRLELRNRTHAVAYAIRVGIL